MKEKLIVLTIVIVLILSAVILLFNNDLNKLNASVETLEYDSDIAILHKEIEDLKLLVSDLQAEIANLDMEIGNVQEELPNIFLDEFIWTTETDFKRVEELLNRIDGIKTVRGLVTGVNRDKELSLDIKLVEFDNEGKYKVTEEEMKILLDDNFTPYMAGQYTLSPIDSEEFIDLMEKNLETGQKDYLSFKMVKGKAVQVYQSLGL